MSAPSRKDRKGVKPRRKRGDHPATATGKLADTTPEVRVEITCKGCYLSIHLIEDEWIDPDAPEGDQRRCLSGESRGELHAPDLLVFTKPRKKKVMGTMTREEYYKR